MPTKPYTLPAKGQDRWWRPIVPVGTTVDRCIKALSAKPSMKGRAAAHHANSDLIIPDEKTGQYAVLERVSEYTSGKVGEIMPPDGCRTLPANSMIEWDVHYWPFGEEIKDDVVELGIWLAPIIKQKAGPSRIFKLYSLLMKGKELEIPPHGTAMTQGFHSFKTRSASTASSRTAIRACVGMTAEIFYPETGKLEMLSSISNWTNQWHTSHVSEDDYAPLVPKGAVSCSRAITTTRRRTRAIPIRGPVGGRRKPHVGRDVARLESHGDAPGRRGLQAGPCQSESRPEGEEDHHQPQPIGL